jgi:hypothetical protein
MLKDITRDSANGFLGHTCENSIPDFLKNGRSDPGQTI